MRVAYAVMSAAVAVVIGCARPRAATFAFDPRCACDGASKTTVAGATSTDDHLDASALDAANEKLGPFDPAKDPTIVLFLLDPGPFDDGVQRHLDELHDEAQKAALSAVDPVERSVFADLRAMRSDATESAALGDQGAAIEAQALLWTRYDEGLKLLEERTQLAARDALADPDALIDRTCADIGWRLLRDFDFGPKTKTMLVRPRLAPFLSARWVERRDAAATEIAKAIVAERRPRWVEEIK